MATGVLNPIWVDDAARVTDLCGRAREAAVVGVDTEADSFHSYFHKLCLIQLSFGGEHALIDPLALGRDELRPFADLLADPQVEKILHGADYDVRVLQRDLGARVVRLADTQVAAQLLGEPQTGLAALVAKELGVELDKRYQRADWGERPLPPGYLAYAAGDTAYLEPLRARLAERLAALGRTAWWREECAALESVEWEAPQPDPLAFERIKGAGRLGGEARDRLAALHAWRERTAAALDVPPFRVLAAEILLALAQKPPADLAQLAATPGVGSSTVRRHGRALLETLAHPPAAPPRGERRRFAPDKVKEKRVRQAREARDGVAAALGLEPGVLGPRAALELIAERMPDGEAGLEDCLARRWRAAVLAPALLPVIAGWRGGADGGGAEPH
ncbi:MAG TPA: HRDC domain-containing protein [Thermoanaerobaculaceae bacterium]|nr:HRDC domain-containing protein [Thermoanaerobaculaceae bacterium]